MAKWLNYPPAMRKDSGSYPRRVYFFFSIIDKFFFLVDG